MPHEKKEKEAGLTKPHKPEPTQPHEPAPKPKPPAAPPTEKPADDSGPGGGIPPPKPPHP